MKYKKKLEKTYNLNYNIKCKAIITNQCAKLKNKIVQILQKHWAKKDIKNIFQWVST
jgi:hypothetical protein